MKYYLGPWVLEPHPMGNYFRAPTGTVGLFDFRSIPGHTGAAYGFFAVTDDITLDSSYELLGQGYVTEVMPNGLQKSAFITLLGLPSYSGNSLMDGIWGAVTMQSDPLGEDSCKPLVPTVGGQWEFHLGGHSLVRNKKFDVNAAEFVPVKTMLQEQYRQVRKDAQDGKLNKDPEFHRKVLDYWGEKYKINNPEDVFIPKGLPKEQRLKHSTTISENFNTADTGTLGPQLTWTEGNGGMDLGVAGNAAQIASGTGVANARAESDLSSDDHYTQVKNTANPAAVDGIAGSITRISGSSFTSYYWADIYRAFTGPVNQKRGPLKKVTGTDTLIGATASITWANTDTIYCESDGSNITAKYNNATWAGSGPITDTSITGNLRTGFLLYRAHSSDDVRLDDFQAADLSVPPPSVSQAIRFYIRNPLSFGIGR